EFCQKALLFKCVRGRGAYVISSGFASTQNPPMRWAFGTGGIVRRRDFLFEHLVSKLFIEDFMKSIAWATLCGAVFAMAIAGLRSGAIMQGLVIFLIFAGLSSVALIYVAVHVVIPLD